jgi:hypothetical protein
MTLLRVLVSQEIYGYPDTNPKFNAAKSRSMSYLSELRPSGFTVVQFGTNSGQPEGSEPLFCRTLEAGRFVSL